MQCPRWGHERKSNSALPSSAFPSTADIAASACDLRKRQSNRRWCRPACVQPNVQPAPHNSTKKISGGGRLNARPCVVGGPPPLRFGRFFVGGRVSVDAGRRHHHQQERALSVRHGPGRRPPPMASEHSDAWRSDFQADRVQDRSSLRPAW
jgi:hypothetical protein